MELFDRIELFIRLDSYNVLTANLVTLSQILNNQ